MLWLLSEVYLTQSCWSLGVCLWWYLTCEDLLLPSRVIICLRAPKIASRLCRLSVLKWARLLMVLVRSCRSLLR